MVVLSTYQSIYEDDRGRPWYSEKWIIENLGYQQVNIMKSADDLLCNITHKVVKRVKPSKTSADIEVHDEWVFAQAYIDQVRKQMAYERTKRRTGKYKVNGKDYPGFILCFFARGLHDGLKRMVIAHTNAIETYFNTRRCVIVDRVVICKKIQSANRKYVFQLLHEYCDQHFKEEEKILSNKAMFDKFLGQDLKHQVVISRPPSQHIYGVDAKYDITKVQNYLDGAIKKLLSN